MKPDRIMPLALQKITIQRQFVKWNPRAEPDNLDWDYLDNKCCYSENLNNMKNGNLGYNWAYPLQEYQWKALEENYHDKMKWKRENEIVNEIQFPDEPPKVPDFDKPVMSEKEESPTDGKEASPSKPKIWFIGDPYPEFPDEPSIISDSNSDVAPEKEQEKKVVPSKPEGWRIEHSEFGDIYCKKIQIKPHVTHSKGKERTYGRIQLTMDKSLIDLEAEIKVLIPKKDVLDKK